MEEIIFMRRLITTDEYFIVGNELLSTHFTHEIFLYTLAFRFSLRKTSISRIIILI